MNKRSDSQAYNGSYDPDWNDFGPEGGTADWGNAQTGTRHQDREEFWGDPGSNEDWSDFEEHDMPFAPASSRPLPAHRRAGAWTRVLAILLALVLLGGLGAFLLPRLKAQPRPQITPAQPAVTPSAVTTPVPTLRPVSTPSPTAKPALTPAPTSPPGPDPTPQPSLAPVDLSGFFYYRSTLSAEEQAVYDAICHTVEAQEEMTEDLRLPDEGRAHQIFDLVLRDRPEYFWVDGSSSSSYYRDGESFVVDFYPNYSMDRQQRDAMQQTVDQICAQLQGRFGSASDYEKIKGVYEYLIDSSVYGDDGLDYSMCGILIHHRGVCNSYAKATQYLLQQLGIRALYVSGYGEGEAHAWNIVLADGAWYQIDTTWGDPITDDGSNQKNFVYFCLTDEEMLRNHQPDGSYSYPVCTATAANWYRREGRWMEQYDEQWLLELMRRDLAESGVVRFRCANEGIYRQAYRSLFENSGLFALLDQMGLQYQYTAYSCDDLFQAVSFSIS